MARLCQVAFWSIVLVSRTFAQGLVEAEDWSTLGKVVAAGPEGVDCLAEPAAGSKPVTRLHFKQVVRTDWTRTGDYTHVHAGPSECWLASADLAAIHKSPVYCLTEQPFTAPLPLKALVASEPRADAGVRVGPVFPTYYQVAYEGYYPVKDGAKSVEVLDERGRKIAVVSEDFHKALMMQGTGRLIDGRVLNVGKVVRGNRRFVALPQGHMGLGIEGYALLPYRSVAVDFDWLCDAIGGKGCTPGNLSRQDKAVSKANRKALAGTLIFVPRLAGIDVSGVRHDGYVCAVDVGGGIKNDRVDLFVGADGAGNPYLPECRRANPWILNGIESLVPWDWHHWESQDGKSVRTRPLEYRENAGHKGLDAVVFPGIRCTRESK